MRVCVGVVSLVSLVSLVCPCDIQRHTDCIKTVPSFSTTYFCLCLQIVTPRGPDLFGWDPIFQPKGFDVTYAEMESDAKNSISHRGRALEKLSSYFTEHAATVRDWLNLEQDWKKA